MQDATSPTPITCKAAALICELTIISMNSSPGVHVLAHVCFDISSVDQVS